MLIIHILQPTPKPYSNEGYISDFNPRPSQGPNQILAWPPLEKCLSPAGAAVLRDVLVHGNGAVALAILERAQQLNLKPEAETSMLSSMPAARNPTP